MSEHIKVGNTLHTPFTGLLGQNMQLTSWSRDTLPQYLWIALILKKFGRDKGLVLLWGIMKELETFDICIADISSVIALDKDQQIQWYDDEVMQMYRPSIRATAQAVGFDLDISFSHSFWNELAQVTPCKPLFHRLSSGFLVA